MTAEQLDYIRDIIEDEGFDYAFTGYSHFRDIEDEDFHKLREAYLKSAKELAKYLNVSL